MKDLSSSTILLLTEFQISKYKRIPGIPKSHKAFIAATGSRPRAAIVLPSGLHKLSMMLGQFSSPDLTAVRININDSPVIICSAYFDITLPIPDPKFSALCDFCNTSRLPLIIGADTNARHIVWGNRLSNTRGIKLLEFLSAQDLTICNQGNEPTFSSPVGSSTIDLTITNHHARNMVSNWKSSFHNSDSDHARLSFSTDLIPPALHTYRNPNNCDWELYSNIVISKLTDKPLRFSPVTDEIKLNSLNNHLTRILKEAFEQACPLTHTTSRSTSPWWNPEISAKRQQVRILHRKARRYRISMYWTLYKEGSLEYKKLIKAAKGKSWAAKCTNLDSMPAAARFNKMMKQLRTNSNDLGALKDRDGNFTTTPRDTLHTLAEELMPNNDIIHQIVPTMGDPVLVEASCTMQRLHQICHNMPSNKAPGTDGIRISQITKCWDIVAPGVLHIIKHSLMLGITPTLWHASQGVVFPKDNKLDYTSPRAFRIISLTSVFQKLTEKIVKESIDHDHELPNTSTDNQHGFKKNYSTESAIHKIIRSIEDAIAAGNQALGVFLDIEGAFDNISFEAMLKNLTSSGIPSTFTNWIYYMISNRTLTLTLNDCSITRKITRGCPQGGVLSPFLWNLTLNDLLSNFDLDKDFLQAFADDLAIVIGGLCTATIRAKCQRYMNCINSWCLSVGVKISAVKTQAIMFTRKRKWSLDRPLALNGQSITLVTEVRYLGVTLDSKLSWRPHIENQCAKATKHLFMFKSACNKLWGLKPVYIKWIYERVVIPALSYGAIVWAHKAISNQSLATLLNRVHRVALLLITGAFSSTSSTALEIITGILPLDLSIKLLAVDTSVRLKTTGHWLPALKDGTLISHAAIIDDWSKSLHPPRFITDLTPKLRLLSNRFSISIGLRSEIPDFIMRLHNSDSWLVFTDGSRKNDLSGAGYVVFRGNVEHSSAHINLGCHATVYQSELKAIGAACSHLLDSTDLPPSIDIFSDSQAALGALNNATVCSSLVRDVISILNDLGARTSLAVHWVPGHSDILGNDRADELANLGSDSRPIGPEPFVPFSASYLKNASKYRIRGDHLARIKQALDPTKFHSRILLHIFLSEGFNLLHTGKRELRSLTHLISGCTYLRYYQHKIGNISNSMCDKCGEEEETTEHFLLACPAYALTRLQIYGNFAVRHSKMPIIANPKALLNFAASTKYLDFYKPP